MPDNPWDGADIIDIYTRRQAIEDGLLVQLSGPGYTGWPREPVGPRTVACLTKGLTAEAVPQWIDTVVLNPEG